MYITGAQIDAYLEALGPGCGDDHDPCEHELEALRAENARLRQQVADMTFVPPPTQASWPSNNFYPHGGNTFFWNMRGTRPTANWNINTTP